MSTSEIPPPARESSISFQITLKSQNPNHKKQIILKYQNPIKTVWKLLFENWKLFEIWKLRIVILNEYIREESSEGMPLAEPPTSFQITLKYQNSTHKKQIILKSQNPIKTVWKLLFGNWKLFDIWKLRIVNFKWEHPESRHRQGNPQPLFKSLWNPKTQITKNK